MKLKAFSAFESKLLKPCKKIFLFFEHKPKKLDFIRVPKIRSNKPKSKKSMSSFLSVFRSTKKCKNMDTLQELRSNSNVLETPLLPSPCTPGYEREDSNRDVEDACRSFEKYLMEMIVEEGKTKDLMDVEELLYCWKNLKCPVFIDIVCRFYGELCRDLFSSDSEEPHYSTFNVLA
ncbi:hypothetical protein TanjilG_32601 [Lupinus angustifolius]|uniref:OVATE domain-containing protein n=1 Tax=Lupinus angustifolius TaxID=3871 RepID=A0A4P1R902_LUPAN|nr:PREDICTED: transcription repressor OFP17 isoform X1 [Lupinus angustifolius]OIW04409.1 hypothetical protein TanjilG_32601 [Lupinus angustifolius]